MMDKTNRTKPSLSNQKPKPYSKPSQTKLSLLNGSIAQQNIQSWKTTMGKPENPITNSDAYERTEHVQSCSKGHQTNESGPSNQVRGGWRKSRNAKLKTQAAEAKTGILKNVVACISGYTGTITNLQLIELIQSNGGEIRMVPTSEVTHLITISGLSGSKTHKFYAKGTKSKMKIVHPDWVVRTVEQGKRLREENFAVIFHETQQSIQSLYNSSTSTTCPTPKPHQQHASARECPSDVPVVPQAQLRKMPPKEKVIKKEEVALEESSITEVEGTTDENVEEEEEELDEWGMPPSGQRC
ncbi:hypothetical protein T439DRAFT_320112 [Meredithblackwellia eburnea MCA 4105]